jgi:hypothetical protein
MTFWRQTPSMKNEASFQDAKRLYLGLLNLRTLQNFLPLVIRIPIAARIAIRFPFGRG